MNPNTNTPLSKWDSFQWKARAIIVELSLIALYLATVCSMLLVVQRSSYGVLGVSAALAIAYLVITFDIEDKPNLMAELYSKKLYKHRFVHMSALALLPIAFSWAMNGEIEASLSPANHWRSEAKASQNLCNSSKSLVEISADNFRVVQNKFNMGIATVEELKSSAGGIKMFGDMHKECLQKANDRKNEIFGNLSRLGLAQTVEVF